MFKAVMMTIAQEFTHHWGILHVYLLQKKCCIMITAYTATDGRVDNSTLIDEEIVDTGWNYLTLGRSAQLMMSPTALTMRNVEL